MSSGKKKHRAVIHIPEIEDVMSEYTELERRAQHIIDYYCTYDCYYMDCGLSCPDDCAVHFWEEVLEKEQLAKEHEVLKSLGLSKA